MPVTIQFQSCSVCSGEDGSGGVTETERREHKRCQTEFRSITEKEKVHTGTGALTASALNRKAIWRQRMREASDSGGQTKTGTRRDGKSSREATWSDQSGVCPSLGRLLAAAGGCRQQREQTFQQTWPEPPSKHAPPSQTRKLINN